MSYVVYIGTQTQGHNVCVRWWVTRGVTQIQADTIGQTLKTCQMCPRGRNVQKCTIVLLNIEMMRTCERRVCQAWRHREPSLCNTNCASENVWVERSSKQLEGYAKVDARKQCISFIVPVSANIQCRDELLGVQCANIHREIFRNCMLIECADLHNMETSKLNTSSMKNLARVSSIQRTKTP